MEDGTGSIWQQHIICIKISGSSTSTVQHSTAQHSTAQHSTAQHSTAQHSTAQHSAAALPTWLPKQSMPLDVISMHSVQDGPDPYVKYSQPAVYVLAQGTRCLGCTHSACTCYAERMDHTQALVIHPSADLRLPCTPCVLHNHELNLYTAAWKQLPVSQSSTASACCCIA